MMIPLYLLFFVGCSCKVAPQIVIEEQPTDYVADIGEWANFNIACTDQKLRYVWQQGTLATNGTFSWATIEDGDNIRGSNANSLFVKVTEDVIDHIAYRCIVVNEKKDFAVSNAARVLSSSSVNAFSAGNTPVPGAFGSPVPMETPAPTNTQPSASLMTETPSSTGTPINTAPAASQEESSYAIITAWSERMSPYETQFAFDYVDWLTGKEAIEKYMLDIGCSQEEAEEETAEYGYIRNVNAKIRWFVTNKATKFYMPDTDMSATPVEVDYKTFLDTMIPAIEHEVSGLTFVRITVRGEYIKEIEWVYLP